MANPTFYVFYGNDEFTIAETVAGLRSRLGKEVADLNTSLLDGRRVTLGELKEVCDTLPFLSDRRLVLVTGLLTRLAKGKGNADFIQGLKTLLNRLPETTRLVFIEEEPLGDDHPILRFARQHERGYERRFEPPSPQRLPAWVIRRARERGGEIEPPAAARLAEVVGSDLRLLDQEIDKLITYAGPDRAVTREDVARLVPYTQQVIIFDLVDALGRREGDKAASSLQRLLEAGESPIGIMGMIVRQFRLLIQVSELRREGENPSSIARILRIHPYPARKLYHQAAGFTTAQLEQIYRFLLKTDLEIKQGKLSPEIGLDLLVAGLTGAYVSSSPTQK